MRIGAVLLAAGAATRMGQTKQLLVYQGQTLVERAIEQAQKAGFAPVVVVVGANAAAVSEAVARTAATIVLNQNWGSGMGSSIGCGAEKITEISNDLDAIAILLADQPFVTAEHLKKIGHAFRQKGAPIVAASYAGTVGVPAVFDKTLFATLQNLAPDAGARTLLRGSSQVHTCELPEAATDIDTPEDFAALYQPKL